MDFFFKEGLRFECQRCGQCCTIPDGYVFIHPKEIATMSHHLNITVEEFLRVYVSKMDGQLVLNSFPNGECIFYNNGCTIYDVRPRQCDTFPFWPYNVDSESDWIELSKECPGVNKGRLWTKEEIIEKLKRKLRRD